MRNIFKGIIALVALVGFIYSGITTGVFAQIFSCAIVFIIWSLVALGVVFLALILGAKYAPEKTEKMIKDMVSEC